jgi:hypothetical protein
MANKIVVAETPKSGFIAIFNVSFNAVRDIWKKVYVSLVYPEMTHSPIEIYGQPVTISPKNTKRI